MLMKTLFAGSSLVFVLCISNAIGSILVCVFDTFFYRVTVIISETNLLINLQPVLVFLLLRLSNAFTFHQEERVSRYIWSGRFYRDSLPIRVLFGSKLVPNGLQSGYVFSHCDPKNTNDNKDPIGTATVLAGRMGTGAFWLFFICIWAYFGLRFWHISLPRYSNHLCDELTDHFSSILEFLKAWFKRK